MDELLADVKLLGGLLRERIEERAGKGALATVEGL